MTKSIVSLVLVALCSGVSCAQEVAVVLTGSLFSRNLTDEERELVEKLESTDRQSDQHIRNFSRELRMFESRTKKLDEVTSIVLLEKGKSVSVRADSSALLLQAHMTAHDISEKECDLEIDWGVAAAVAGVPAMASWSEGRSKNCPLNHLTIDGPATAAPRSGQKDGAAMITTIRVVPAKEHSISQKKNNRISELLKQKFPRPLGPQIQN